MTTSATATRTANLARVTVVADTRAEAEAIVALFPKSYRAKLGTHFATGEAPRPTATVYADLNPNAANEGANEAGIARVEKAIAKLEAAGITVEAR